MKNKFLTLILAFTVTMSGIPFAGTVQADASEFTATENTINDTTSAVIADAESDNETSDNTVVSDDSTDTDESASDDSTISESSPDLADADPEEAVPETPDTDSDETTIETEEEAFSDDAGIAIESEDEELPEAEEETKDTDIAAGENTVSLGANGQKIRDTYGIKTIYQVQGKGNVRSEVNGYINNRDDLSTPTMIYFPAGSYTMSGQLRVGENLYIVAENNSTFTGTTVNMSGSDSLVYGGVWNGNFRIAGTSNRIENCTIQNVTGNNGHGVGVYNTQTATVTNCKILNNAVCGISVYGGAHVNVYGCNISGNGHNGIGVRKNASVTTGRNCVFDSNKYDGIAVADKSRAVINDTVISRSGYMGVTVCDSSQATISGSTITGSKSINLVVVTNDKSSGPSTVTMNGKNTISSSKESQGISVTGKGNTLAITGSTTVSGNAKNGICVNPGGILKLTGTATITGNKAHGITLETATAIIKNATVKKNKLSGIMISKKSKVSELSNNTVTGNKQFGIALLNSTVKKVKKNKLSNPSASSEIMVSKCKTNAKNLSRISAKKVRSSSRKVTGKAQKKTSIIITGGKKTYKGKVSANGKYSVRIAKQKKGTRLRIAARDKNKNEAFTIIKVK